MTIRKIFVMRISGHFHLELQWPIPYIMQKRGCIFYILAKKYDQ